LTKNTLLIGYYVFGDKMKVKIFDCEDEGDLEEDINSFINNNRIIVIDIKYQVGVSVFSEEQIFCFSGMIIYKNIK
jgi:hypothetical protein